MMGSTMVRQEMRNLQWMRTTQGQAISKLYRVRIIRGNGQ